MRDKKRTRLESGRFFVEGAREVERALRSGIQCDYLVYCPLNLDAQELRLVEEAKTLQANLEVSVPIFRHLVVREESVGICGVFMTPDFDLANSNMKKNPLVIIVENLEKPGNLGALLRCADGAGVDQVILTESSVEVFNPNVIRSSIGTVFNIPVYVCSNEQALAFCESHNLKCFAAAPAASRTYFQADLSSPTAIILGNEAQGLSKFWLSKCEGISLPMLGIADSLNVSATGAILVYEALRQRHPSHQ